MHEKVAAVIVTFNGRKWYDRSIGRLVAFNPEVDVLVVDNASTDGSAGLIREQFPSVRLTASDTNLGFARANNLAIKQALDSGADYILLLNQDAWVNEHTVQELVRTFVDNDRTGIAVPIHMDGEGTSLDWYFAYNAPALFTSDAYSQTLRPYYEVNYMAAAAWMVSRKCLETIGGFDTDLFCHYGEDENYCQRLHYHGFAMVVNTRCTICHDHLSVKQGAAYAGRDIWKNRNQTLHDKICLADISRQDIQIDQLLLAARVRGLLSLLKGSFKQHAAFRDRVDMLKQVRASRRISMTTGPHWLS